MNLTDKWQLFDCRGKKWRELFLYSFFLYIALFFCQLIQVSYFMEDGVYASFTLSFILDGDLNVFNQMLADKYKWLATNNYYHPDFRHSGIVLFTTPFYLYAILIKSISSLGENLNDYRNFMTAHILSTLFYVAVALGLLKNVLTKIFGTTSFAPGYLFIFSTCFIWYAFFQSTGTDIFGFFYTSIVLYLYFFLDESRRADWAIFFSFALFGAFGAILRVQLGWVGVLVLFLLWEQKERRLRMFLISTLGVCIPMCLYLINEIARSSGSLVSLSNFIDPRHGINLNSFIGPNGFLVLAPAFLIPLVGQFLLLKEKKKLHYQLFIMGIPGIILYGSYAMMWAQMDCLVGRHQITFLPLYAIYTIFLYRACQAWGVSAKRIFVFFLALFFIWNIHSHWWFYSVDRSMFHNWKFIYPTDIKLLISEGKLFLTKFSPSQMHRAFVQTIPYFPLITAALFLVQRLRRFDPVKLTYLFAAYLLLFYGVITASNWFMGKYHVEEMKSAGAYQSTVISGSERLNMFDDYVQVLHDAIRLQLQEKNCEYVQFLRKTEKRYFRRVAQDILVDPIGFKDQLMNHGGRSVYDIPVELYSSVIDNCSAP